MNFEKNNLNEWLEVLATAARGKEYAALYKRVHYLVNTPSRSRKGVNLYKINKFTKAGDTIIVPRKVLSLGTMDHKINIVALEYSGKAKEQLMHAGCKIMTIKEVIGHKKVNVII